MTTLAEFLLARIADDEAKARAAIQPQYGQTGEWLTFDDKEHLARSVVFARNGADRLGQACDTAMSWIGIPARDHIARWDPARVLAECDAKRKLVQLAQHINDNAWQDGEMEAVSAFRADRILRALALPYADHENYRPEWRP